MIGDAPLRKIVGADPFGAVEEVLIAQGNGAAEELDPGTHLARVLLETGEQRLWPLWGMDVLSCLVTGYADDVLTGEGLAVDGLSFGNNPGRSSQTSIVNFKMSQTYSLIYPVRVTKRVPVRIPVAPKKPVSFRLDASGVRGWKDYNYLLSASSSEGFIPRLFDPTGVSVDGRNLGVLVRFTPLTSAPMASANSTRPRRNFKKFHFLKKSTTLFASGASSYSWVANGTFLV